MNTFTIVKYNIFIIKMSQHKYKNTSYRKQIFKIVILVKKELNINFEIIRIKQSII